MKNKVINSKMEALSGRINSIKSKAENASYLKESGTFKSLDADLEAATLLQKEVLALKDSLKAKTLELKEGIAKLRKSSKDAGKVLKKEKKSIKSSGKDKIRKEKSSAIRKTLSKRGKTAKSIKRPSKNKK